MQSLHVPDLGYYRDSYAMTDFEPGHFKPRQTGPSIYDRSDLSRIVGLFGVGVAALLGAACIIGGYMIFRSQDSFGTSKVVPSPGSFGGYQILPSQGLVSTGIVVISVQNSWEKEAISLALNLVVTICTEATGFVHGIALRASLASEQRLHFNTNLRLLSGRVGRGFFDPSGTAVNLVMAILLIVSYSSSLLVTLSVNLDSSSGARNQGFAICASEVPLIVLGVTLLLQAIIALASVRDAGILTWSSSPFDITAALVSQYYITPERGRCMHSVRDDASRGAVVPSSKQPSAWRAHPSVKKVVMTILALVVACTIWGVAIMCVANQNLAEAVRSWSFFPQPQSHVVAYSIPITSGVYWYWVLYYLNMLAIQGPLTLVLHCCELIANVIRDERMWRRATRRSGTKMSTDPVTPIIMHPLNLALFLLKPLLHWMLGLAISLAGTASSGHLTSIGVSMWPFQILNYSAALLGFSLVLLAFAVYQPRGAQPAAYGHIQTLANLIDEWSPRLWWGDKGAGFRFRHAGTSDSPLPTVDMGASYA